MLKSLMTLVTLFALSGCAGLLNATVSTGGLSITRDIAYGKLPRQQLDIYQPAAASPGPHPIVVFLYGGSWKTGSKEIYRFAAAAMARLGAVVVVPDYRLFPEAPYPVFLQDCARATAWAQAHAAAWGGDPDRVFVMGHSAGAYNAAMLATDPALLQAAGGQQSRLRGFIGLAGPYDFLPITDPDIIPIFPATDDPATMPVNYVRAGRFVPPMLLLAGMDDQTVRPRNSLSLATYVRRAGGHATVTLYPGTAHIGIVLDLTWPFRGRAPVLDDVMRFIQAAPTAASALPAPASTAK